jgi:hypothetical protein
MSILSLAKKAASLQANAVHHAAIFEELIV